MKNLLRMLVLNILLGFSSPVMSAAGTYTNGVYCERGTTTEIDKSVHQFTPKTMPENLHFSNGMIVKVEPDADFVVNSFFQDVLNVEDVPEKLKSHTHNFAATLNKGTCIVTYDGGDENSSCVISTPFTDHELSKGIYYFNVSGNRVIVYSIEGSIKTTSGNSRTTTTTPIGYAVIAMNSEDAGILESKVSIYTDKLKPDVVHKIMAETDDIINSKNSIMFIRINHKTTGVVIN